jgi:hypothetical protein
VVRRAQAHRKKVVVAMGGLCAVVPVLLPLSGAFRIQVVVGVVGAATATAGVAFGLAGLPRRRSSELHNLLAAFGFFLLCGGLMLMLAGIGIYH